LVITLGPEQFSKQHVVDLFYRLGHPQLAEEAKRALPDPVGVSQVMQWAMEHGLTHDDIISEMGGSP
jgi:hypothetical protein